jgi:hypothetical protein
VIVGGARLIGPISDDGVLSCQLCHTKRLDAEKHEPVGIYTPGGFESGLGAADGIMDWSGFEPEASGLQNRRSSELIYQPASARGRPRGLRVSVGP